MASKKKSETDEKAPKKGKSPEADASAPTPKEPEVTRVAANATVKQSIKVVKRSDIVVDQKLNAREVIDPTKPDPQLIALGLSIRESGLQNPMQVRQLPDGKLELRAGFRRYFATGELRGQDEDGTTFHLEPMEEVPVVVFSSNDLVAMVKTLEENVLRQDLTPWELAQGIWQLKDLSIAAGVNNGEGYGPTEIARLIHYSRPTVSNLLGWRKLIPSIKKALSEGLVTSTEANRWYSLTQAEQRDAFAEWKSNREDDGSEGSGSNGGKEGKAPPMLRKEKVELLMNQLKDATEIRVGGSFVELTDEVRKAVKSTLGFVLKPSTRYPIRGHEQEEEEETEGEE